jgi:hypothetical protein
MKKPRASSGGARVLNRTRTLNLQIQRAITAALDVASLQYLCAFLYRQLVTALVTHLVLPPVAATLVIRFAGLGRYKNSRIGAYLIRYMTPFAQATRLVGDVITSTRPSGLRIVR